MRVRAHIIYVISIDLILQLVEYKQQTRLEEKRKKALDQHLNFIVGQTEKYSTWLTEGLNKIDGPQSVPASMNSSRISSPIPPGKYHSDGTFVLQKHCDLFFFDIITLCN